MVQFTRQHQWLSFAAIDVLFTADVLLKFVIQQNETIRYVINTNAAFSLPIDSRLLIVFSILVIIFFLRLFVQSFRNGPSVMQVLYLFVIFGALSNTIDRIFYGGVVDYIFIHELFPAFNIADILITLGIGGLIVFHRKRPSYAP